MDFIKKFIDNNILNKNIKAINEDLCNLINKGNDVISYDKEYQTIMENIVECLLSKDNQDNYNFEMFCEYQMIEKIIILTKYHDNKINLIVIKNIGIILSSLQDKQILFYFFSKNYMNQIITNISYNKEGQDSDYLSYYINFLKTISQKLDHNNLRLFFHPESNSFPLLDESCYFLNNTDMMIKNTSRNIFLTILKLNYLPIIQYMCNIPRISDFLIINQKVLSGIILLTNLKTENETNIDLTLKIKELEENLNDDILFIQDILSVGILKINYILTNCLFSIPLQNLFNNILIHSNVSCSFYILNLFFKNLKDNAIKNLLSYILFSPSLSIKLIEFIASCQSMENSNLLTLNNYLFSYNYTTKVKFDDYLILNYNENFLRSIKYKKDDINTYQELKEISRELSRMPIDSIQDFENIVQCINKKITKNIDLLKKMRNYHNFISKSVGINLGISYYEAQESFLQIMYINFKYIFENGKNFNFQENLLRKELFQLFSSNIIFQQNTFINELFLFHNVIYDKSISSELKMLFDFMDEDCYKSNNTFIDINSFEQPHDNDENNISDEISLDDELKNEENYIPKSNYPSQRDCTIKNVKENIYKFLGNKEEAIIDYKNKFENIFGDFNIYKNTKSTVGVNLPRPVNMEISSPNVNSIYISCENKIINFNKLNFNNNLIKESFKQFKRNKNKSNNDSKFNLLEILLNNLFFKDYYFTKMNYKISFSIIYSIFKNFNKTKKIFEKFKKDIYCNYIKTLKLLSTILNNNNDDLSKYIFKYSYKYFQENFEFHNTSIQNIIEEYFDEPILLYNTNCLKVPSILKQPKTETEIIECLLIKYICLHDIKKLILNKTEELFFGSEFPLNFCKLKFKIGEKVNLNLCQIEIINVLFKIKRFNKFEKYFMFIYHNYIFFATSDEQYQNLEIRKLDPTHAIIKYKYPLRDIIVYSDRGDPRQLTIYIMTNLDDLEITLQFEDTKTTSRIKKSVDSSIKCAILLEFSSITSFINQGITDFYKENFNN